MPFSEHVMSSRRREGDGGFTLIEVLFGLLILGLVMTTSLAVFYERQNRVRFAEETVLVWQAIANESELIRFAPWQSLDDGSERPFTSSLQILDSLENPSATVAVEQTAPRVKEVTLRIAWGGGRSATSTVIRTDTGGANLW